MRGLIAVVTGGVIAIVAYWGGAVVALVAMHGIPLGSSGGPPTSGDILVHLLLATIATGVGVLVAIRVARGTPTVSALAVVLLLGIGAIVGFGKPASHWPPWFGPAMAAACAVGGIAAVGLARLRHSANSAAS